MESTIFTAEDLRAVRERISQSIDAGTYTRTRIATEAKIHPQHLRDYLAGESDITTGTLARLLEAERSLTEPQAAR